MSHGTNLLLSFAVSETGLQDYLKLSPTEDDFKGENEKTLFSVVHNHVLKFGAVPKYETLEAELEKAGYSASLPPASSIVEPPAYYYDKVRERSIHLALKSGLQQTATLLNGAKVNDALNTLVQLVSQLQYREMKNRLVNFSEEGYQVIKDELIKQSKGLSVGLKLGWPYLDNLSNGLMPGDVLSIIGRPAQGKTFCLLYNALYGWNAQGQRPLVVSMEMGALSITQRLAAMNTHTSLTHLKTGQLDTALQLKPMLMKLKKNKGREPFWVVDGALAVNVSQVRLLAMQLGATAVYIDGAYLMRHENPKINRWERVTDNAERIKSEIAEDLGLPVTISYQFNRAATEKKVKGHGEGGLENIAYTDAIGQLSSIVLGMMQEESVETIKHREISVLKGRDGQVGKFKINWEFDHPNAMDFSEYVEKSVEDLSYV